MRKQNAGQPLLLPKSEVQRVRAGMFIKSIEYGACLLVAFPTAVLNSLAAVSGDAAAAENLHSVDDLYRLLSQKSIGRIAYGVVALFASEAVLFFLNKRYLLASGKAAIDLLRRTSLTLRSLCCYTLLPGDRAYVLENVLFIWSILTSLIFAEMGGKALSFLGFSGELIGFTLSLMVYFATRFSSAKMYFDNISNKNWRLKQKYIKKLALLEEGQVQLYVNVDAGQSTDYALMRFLNQVDNEWEGLPKSKVNLFLIQYTSALLGYLLALLTVLPIMSGFMPESIQGLELLTNTPIGAASNYQNVVSFMFGMFATLLTLFFYELNIKALPEHLLRFSLLFYKKIKRREISSAFKLASLTVISFFSSYITGIGFKFVADMALRNGYLSYLGTWVSNKIPVGLLIAVISMLWAHLQYLANQSVMGTADISTVGLNRIDIKIAQFLLGKSDTDISPLLGNRLTLFGEQPARDVSKEMMHSPLSVGAV